MKPFPILVTFVIGASIAATGLVVGDFNPVAQAVAVAVAALAVGASFSRWRGAIWFVRGVLFAAGWSALWLAVYGAAVWIAPPVTADGHRVMPMGQVFLAFIGSTVLAPAAAFYYVKTGRANVKTEAVVVRVLAAVMMVTALVVNLQFES
ncbi:MAG: hypothetical protein ACREUW_12555 [Burkholderiales bacterium]